MVSLVVATQPASAVINARGFRTVPNRGEGAHGNATSILKFPRSFVFGAATSAYQVEGAKNFQTLNIGGSGTTSVSFVVGVD